MATKKAYLALNKKNRSFTDPSTLFSIQNDQIKEVPHKLLYSHHVVRALRHGHLVKKTETEYKEYMEMMEKLEATQVDKTKIEEYIKSLEKKVTNLIEENEAKDKIIKALRDSKSEEEEDELTEIEKLPSKQAVIDYLEENFEIEKIELKRLSKLSREELDKEANEIVNDSE